MAFAALYAGCHSPDFTISGRLASGPGGPANLISAATDARKIDYVMAVNPETASPRRTLAQVADDGTFKLAIDSGSPYVLVFIDSHSVGAAMVVAIFRARTLHTIAPAHAGKVDLGDVVVEKVTATATAGVSYESLLASLGLTAAGAEYLGSIDDLSLRYANPDIDGDGVIDLLQGRRFQIDFHVRSNMRSAATGLNFTVADMTDQFFPASGPAVATPVFNLTSIYVEYPKAFDATEYVAMTSGPGALEHGAAFTAAQADGSVPAVNLSFSALQWGDTSGWSPDYDYEKQAGVEIPGSGGSPATLTYTLGASGKQLTFTNVVTRTRASLIDGTLSIFVRLNTAAGVITSVDYEWRKRNPTTGWAPATSEEIALTIGSAGGFMSVHRVPSWHDEIGLAISYDDKLGLRHFIGGADANAGVTCAQ